MPVKISTHSKVLGLAQKYIEGESGSEFHTSQGSAYQKHTPSFSAQPISSPSPTSIEKGPGFLRHGQAQNKWTSLEAGIALGYLVGQAFYQVASGGEKEACPVCQAKSQ